MRFSVNLYIVPNFFMQIVDERKSQLEDFFTFAMNPLCKTYGGSRLTTS